jgi:hypothetical protein
MSSILDALRKAGDDRAPVRSPLVRGDLYTKTRVAPPTTVSRPSRFPWSGRLTPTTLAVGSIILTATVLTGVILWSSGQASSGTGQTLAARTVSPPVETHSTSSPVDPGTGETGTGSGSEPAPGAAGATAQTRRLVDEYLSAQLLPTVPINVGANPSGDPETGSDGTSGGEEPTTPPEPEEPTYTLEGVVWDTRAPMAIINGRILGVGGTIEGAVIMEIGRDSVLLSVDGQDKVLTY